MGSLPERTADSPDPGRDLPAQGLMTLIGFKAAWLKGAGVKSTNGRQRSPSESDLGQGPREREARRRRAARERKKEDQVCGQRVAEMAKMRSCDAFHALEAAIFSGWYR